MKAWLMSALCIPLVYLADGVLVRRADLYNLDKGVALKGYDPVAIFPEGGGQPTPGVAEFSLEYSGVIYRFAREANRQLFAAEPSKYEPTYGGWCAYAMASGSQVDIQPQLFTIHGRRAHYFVSNRAKANFDRQLDMLERDADRHWRALSSEEPRQ